jgi:hypothetical protein
MVRTKKCDKEKMFCENVYCSNNVKKELNYYYLEQLKNIFTEFEAYEVNIISENKDHKIVTNERTFSACLSKDYYCKLKYSIIVWEDEIVHDCSFSIVKSIQLQIIGKALMNTKENKYFEFLENVILAEMDNHSINLLQTITMLTRQTNEKICKVYKTFMNM